MTEKEMVQMMYTEHKKWLLSAEETATACGMSYSKFTKLFGGKDAIPEKIILEKKIIPQWIIIGATRKWKITEIVKWILETEKKVA